MEFKDLLKASIYWQRHETESRYLFAYYDSQLLLLRMNDFPDEPLYTLIRGLEIISFDDAPEIWVIPHN